MFIFGKTKSGDYGFFPLDMRADYEAAGSWPAEGVEVTQEGRDALAGKNVVADANGFPVEYVKPEPTLDELKATKIVAINTEASRVAGALTAGYPDFELQTWPDQKAEAIAWKADSTSPTPVIDAMAGYRGIPRLDYLARTYAKVVYFQKASGYLVGTRQGYVDQANAAKSKTALDKIVPVFTLPAP